MNLQKGKNRLMRGPGLIKGDQKNQCNSRDERCDMKNVDVISHVMVNGKSHLATINMLKGNTLYGEKLVSRDGNEYRTWDPFRSKLAAAIRKVYGLTSPKLETYYILVPQQELQSVTFRI